MARKRATTGAAAAAAESAVASLEPPASPPPAAYTIDQLSQRTGVPGRTIRFYQSQGVLPSPRRQGRLAYYDDDHVQRLQLIAELRDKGLRLDAVRDALAQLESGSDSLHHWLGLSDRLADSWVDERPALMTADDFQQRYGKLRRGFLADLEAYGVIRREGTGVRPTYLVPHLTHVDNAVALEAAGVDLAVAVTSVIKIMAAMSTLAEELVADYVAYFRDDLLRGDTEGPERVQKAMHKLRLSGIDTLRISFGEEVDRVIRSLVEGGPNAIDAMVEAKARREGGRAAG